MENVFLTSLTTPEVRQMFREELTSFFPNGVNNSNENLKPQIMTGEDICQKLGITIQTLINWRNKGKVPFFKLGASIRYDFIKVLEALEVKKSRTSK